MTGKINHFEVLKLSFANTNTKTEGLSDPYLIEARKSRVIFFELFFRVTKKPSYDVIFRKFCLNHDVIINLVTRLFLLS